MRIFLLNQAFFPDVVASGQHLTDLAVGLAQAGHEVTVVASARGYDDPERRFRRREVWNGVHILRVPTIYFGGKGSRWRRALEFGSFVALCSLQLLTVGRFDVIVAMTSPPLISVLGALFSRLRGGRLVFWAMDVNPDEAIAAGWLKPDSTMARLLESLLRFSLRSSSNVVVLDRFMEARILARGIDPAKVTTIAPWAHDDTVAFDADGRKSFRRVLGCAGKFVVMYSGNHSPCHPLDTLLQAALELRDEEMIGFVFSGGGSEVEKVRRFAKRHELTNVVQAPYQPLSELGALLSAADLHVVVLGEPFVGIVHPCKLYNVLRVGSPVLYIGPEESHIADIASHLEAGMIRTVRHGDVDGVVDCVLEAFGKWRPDARRQEFGGQYSKEVLLPVMILAVVGDPHPAFGHPLPEGEGLVPMDGAFRQNAGSHHSVVIVDGKESL